MSHIKNNYHPVAKQDKPNSIYTHFVGMEIYVQYKQHCNILPSCFEGFIVGGGGGAVVSTGECYLLLQSGTLLVVVASNSSAV